MTPVYGTINAARAWRSGRGWPARHFLRVAGLTIAGGVLYTIFSEWLNVSIRHSWNYSQAMPRLPVLGTGLAPFLQWIVVPLLALVGAGWPPPRARLP